eukprot:snap_masked-scaffold_66-processed-gene-0.26-mRNA-1 protein AED:1.00 eAED:1.00 QI:0/-1/0/0/-1/1/1/0/82
MVTVFETNEKTEWDVDGFQIRYEWHDEPTRRPRVLTNILQQIMQDAKSCYVVSFHGEMQFTMIQHVEWMFEIFLEESDVTMK